MAKEIEAKIRVADLEAVRTRLADLGAADEGEAFERNWVLDTVDGELRRRDVLLRIRSHGDPGGILTVKHKVEQGEFKSREEVESMVDSTDDLLRQFEMLGYGVCWIYEKRRRTMLWRDCVIALDQCPEIGGYVEIEGAPANIRNVAEELDLDPDAHIDGSYLDLWEKHLAAIGSPLRHMIFPTAFTVHGGE